MITTFVPPFTKVPNINDSVNFENDTNTFLGEMESRFTAGNEQVAQINTVANEINTAKAEVDAKALQVSQVEPTSGGYSQEKINQLTSTLSVVASGYLTNTLPSNRWLETNTPNVIVDKVGDDYVINGVVYNQLGNELVANGTFDTDTSGWSAYSGASITSENGRLKITRGTANLSSGYTLSNLVVGKTYNLSLYANTGNLLNFVIGASATSSPVYTLVIPSLSDGLFNMSFNATQSTMYIQTQTFGAVGTLFYLDNISVKELKKATLPLAPFSSGADEKLDTDIYGLATQINHSKGDYIVCKNGSIYQAITTTIAGDLLSNALLFKTKTDLKHYDLIYLNSGGLVAERTLFDLANKYDDDVSSSLGYSKKSNGLFINDTTPIHLVRSQLRYNAGIYHATYNPYGTRTSVNTPTSTYECFTLSHNNNGNIASGSSANGIYYDKIYINKGIDLYLSAKEPTNYNYLGFKILKDYIANTNYFPIKSNQTLLTDYITHNIVDSSNNRYFPLNVKSGVVKINEANNNKTLGTIVKDSNNRLRLQIVNDTNLTDNINATSATNNVIFLPFYVRGI